MFDVDKLINNMEFNHEFIVKLQNCKKQIWEDMTLELVIQLTTHVHQTKSINTDG